MFFPASACLFPASKLRPNLLLHLARRRIPGGAAATGVLSGCVCVRGLASGDSGGAPPPPRSCVASRPENIDPERMSQLAAQILPAIPFARVDGVFLGAFILRRIHRSPVLGCPSAYRRCLSVFVTLAPACPLFRGRDGVTAAPFWRFVICTIESVCAPLPPRRNVSRAAFPRPLAAWRGASTHHLLTRR